MRNTQAKKLALSGILVAIAVVGSLFSFPIFGSRAAPVQHIINSFSAVFLGPWYGVGIAFAASLIRNLFALGTPLAFTSILGAFLSGIIYRKVKRIYPTLVAEVIGSGILGGLAAYPIAILFMGEEAGNIAFYVYVIPFLISTVAGVVLSGIIIKALEKNGAMKKMHKAL